MAQVLGAVAGAGILYLIAPGKDGFSLTGGFAANAFGEPSSGSYPLCSALNTEVVLTFMFLVIILGATDKKAAPAFAAFAIGLGLTLSTSSVSPSPICRSTRHAALAQTYLSVVGQPSSSASQHAVSD